MIKRTLPFPTLMAVMFIGVLVSAAAVAAAEDTVDFDSDRWTLMNAEVAEHLGRKSLAGTAVLEDVEFENGVIEVDIAVTGGRSYPGVIFRRQSDTDYERFYVRPHRATGLYSDALQYTPVINRIAGWQLYSGDGFTAAATIPTDQWVHLKLEVLGTQARVYVGDEPEPDLVIHDLKHGVGKGGIGLMGPRDGSAFFADFRYRTGEDLAFDPPPETPQPLGMITEWELSRPFKYSQLDIERTPEQQGLTDLRWKKVSGEETGLVDIARFVERTPGEPDFVWARKVIPAKAGQTGKLEFGYSDYIGIFLNGRLVFMGNSAYRSRSPGFAGIVGLNDTVYLPLVEGENELLLLVGETFGGWGFMVRDANAVFVHERLSLSWEVAQTFKFPESVVYDRARDVLYVSNFFTGGEEFISKVKRDGTIVDLEWVTGLDQPTGLCVSGEKLLAVERSNLVEILIDSGKIVARHPVPDPGFPNDIACDPSGAVFISDSRKDSVYRFENGEFEVWVQGGEIDDPNGLLLDADRLLVGNSSDGCLKAVNLSDRTVETVACFGSGSIMDGVRSDGQGHYIVSDFNGRAFLVSPSGEKTALLDTTARGIFCADLEYVAEHGLMVVPTLNDNRLMAYELAAE